MKVLKPGRPQQGWSIEQVCSGAGNGGGGCGALLLVEQVDLFQTSSSARDETDYFITFECPSCTVKTDLKARLSDRVPVRVTELPTYDAWKKQKSPGVDR